MTATNRNQNICTHDTRNRPIGLEGDAPTPVKIVRKYDGKTLGAVTTGSGFICLLQAYRLNPSDVALDCCIDQARVWRDVAWRSDELAEYCSDGEVA